MPLPLLAWWAIAALTTTGGIAIAADQIGDAAEQSEGLMNSTSKIALVGTVGFLAWTFRDQIKDALK